ncbi:MAG: NAD(P)-dependent dehydrogenase (short-subunit alcohol dehydrogenase family) [Thermoproteota archaeon]|jgi:NAD(P)-dependent dehydrogenase (short-subunit alcohol dehydrogenase family)
MATGSNMAGRAVVTGGGRGIGAAIVERLRSDGYEVVVLDALAGAGVVQCDITDPDQVRAAAYQIGPVDVIVNNAGAWRFGALEDVSAQDFAVAIDVNLRGAFHVVQSFGRSMLDRGSGCIVNIVSIAAKHANPAVGSYGPSKAALLSLTEQIALEWGPRGVRCNAVGPGLVPTPGTGDVYDDPEVRAVREAAIPMRRLGQPSDIANVVAFLVSDDAAYVNGQVIYVDGGLSKGLMTLLPRPTDIASPNGE